MSSNVTVFQGNFNGDSALVTEQGMSPNLGGVLSPMGGTPTVVEVVYGVRHPSPGTLVMSFAHDNRQSTSILRRETKNQGLEAQARGREIDLAKNLAGLTDGKGRGHSQACPRCNWGDGRPVFYFQPSTARFLCGKCKFAGDIFDLISVVRKITRDEAVAIVAEYVGYIESENTAANAAISEAIVDQLGTAPMLEPMLETDVDEVGALPALELDYEEPITEVIEVIDSPVPDSETAPISEQQDIVSEQEVDYNEAIDLSAQELNSEVLPLENEELQIPAESDEDLSDDAPAEAPFTPKRKPCTAIVLSDHARHEHEYGDEDEDEQHEHEQRNMVIALDPKQPFISAKAFVGMRYMYQGVPTLCHYDKNYWQWKGNAYQQIETATVKREILSFLEQAKVGAPGIYEGSGGSPFPVASRHVSEIEKLLKDMMYSPLSETIPYWIGDTDREQPYSITDPRLLVFGKSSTLNLVNMEVLPPTPLWFNTGCLDYDYDPEATCPAWDAFLNDLFGEDEESKAAVMEFMGLSLTHITNFQKSLFLIGPRRSGKGTIARITQAMVGKHNAEPMSTSDFAENFAFHECVGKTFVVVGEAKFEGQRSMSSVVAKILSILGEDDQKIHRKHITALKRRLTAKFMFQANGVPAVPDASGAFPSRFVFVKLTESFLGRENRDLETQLLSELPGILNLAIKHLHNLLERGHFIQPESGKPLYDRMLELGSPVSKFIDLLPPYPTKAVIWELWKEFCEEAGIPIRKQAVLWRDLEAAGYNCDFDAANILERIRKSGGEVSARDLRDCARIFKNPVVFAKKLQEMVDLGLLQERVEIAGNNREVKYYSLAA